MELVDDTSEYRVLSAAMRSAVYALELGELVHADDFGDATYGAAWAEIQARAAQGADLDGHLIATALRESGRIPDAAADVVETMLSGVACSGSAIAGHVARVVELARRRRIQAAVAGIDKAAEAADLSPETIEDYALQRILALSTTQRGARDLSLRPALRQALKDLEARANGAEPGIATPWPALDRLTFGWHRGELAIIAGRPSMGKTAAVMQAVIHAARRGVPAFVVSLEMARPALSLRMLAAESGVDHRALCGGTPKDTDWPRLHETMAHLMALPIEVDDTPALSIGEIQARARRARARGACGLVVVDYLQLAHGDRQRKSDNREQEIASISGGLKELARSLDVPVIALSQLNRSLEMRPIKAPPGGSDRRPRLSDLRESGAIEQDADLILFVYRESVYTGREDDDSAEFIIGKQRNGPKGTVPLRFRSECVRFEDRAPGYREDERYGR